MKERRATGIDRGPPAAGPGEGGPAAGTLAVVLRRARSWLLAALLAATGLWVPVARAEPLPPGIAGVEMLAGWRTEAGTRMAALRLRLEPGWKTYWRAPGDAGIPPRLDWTGSENLAAAALHFPRPKVFSLSGLRAIGYGGELVLPIEITPRDAGVPVRLSALLDIGVCRDICVPVKLRLGADLSGPGAEDPAIRAALAAMPVRRPGLARCAVEPIRDGMRVTAAIALPARAPDEVVLFELPGQRVWISQAVQRREGDMLHATADFVPETAAPFALDRSKLRITVLAGGEATDIPGCPG